MTAGQKGSAIRTLVAAGLAGAWLLFFLPKGLCEIDEGHYLDLGGRILHGEVPYRDFMILQTPGHYYLFAGLEALFGPGLLPSRIAWWAVGVLMAVALSEVVARGLSPWLAGLAGACAVIGTLPNLTFLSYYWTANLAGLWALVFVLRSQEGAAARRLWFAGALGTLAFFLKQSAGAYAAVGLALATLVLPTPDGAGPWRRLVRLAAGAFVALAIVQGALLAAHVSIADFWSSAVGLFRLRQRGFEVPIPAPWDCFPLQLTGDGVRNSVYYLPILAVALTLLRESRRRATRDASAQAAALYALPMLLQLTPRAKWPTLSMALFVPFVLLVLAAAKASVGRPRRRAIAWALFLAATLGVLIEREFDYHQGEDVPLDGPYKGICGTREQSEHLLRLKGAVVPLLGPGDTFLTLPSDTTLYPYLDRPCRFRVHYLLEGDQFLTVMMQDVERVKPRVILLGRSEGLFLGFRTFASPLFDRIRETYKREQDVDGTEFWVLRE